MNKPFKTASYRTFIFLCETYCLIEINIPSQFYLDYQENLFNALTALNGLLQTREMCNDDKAIIKVNRFRKWLIDRIESDKVSE